MTLNMAPTFTAKVTLPTDDHWSVILGFGAAMTACRAVTADQWSFAGWVARLTIDGYPQVRSCVLRRPGSTRQGGSTTSEAGGLMGKASRTRRQRARTGEGRRVPDVEGIRGLVPQLVDDALAAVGRQDDAALDRVVFSFEQCCAVPAARREIVTVVTKVLTNAVTEAWRRGWQPADLHRLAARQLSRPDLGLLLDVLSLELDGYPAAAVDRRWWAQLAELEGRIWWSASQTMLEAHRQRSGDWAMVFTSAFFVLHLLVRLPRLECLTPLPGEARPGDGGARSRPGRGDATGERPPVDDRILSRVRQMLAKAESTTFEAEAETFTAAAQSLMARHSIDAALLAASRPRSAEADQPQARRIGVDNPYDSPKAMLLNAVAAANRCRMVWSRELGLATVVGFGADLECVELLFTSLLVQATRAVTAAGSRTDAFGRSRTRSFRQSFLMAYAGRIGERLSQATAAEVDAATADGTTGGRELVPVLAARDEEVGRAVDALFPVVQQRSISMGRDAEGWHRGRVAADLADLGAGDSIESS